MPDVRVAYGASCTWWGGIHQVGLRRLRLGDVPCCPFCHGPLFETDNEAEFLRAAQEYEDKGHRGYVSMVKWSKGKPCFRSVGEMVQAYARYVASRN